MKVHDHGNDHIYIHLTQQEEYQLALFVMRTLCVPWLRPDTREFFTTVYDFKCRTGKDLSGERFLKLFKEADFWGLEAPQFVEDGNETTIPKTIGGHYLSVEERNQWIRDKVIETWKAAYEATPRLHTQLGYFSEFPSDEEPQEDPEMVEKFEQEVKRLMEERNISRGDAEREVADFVPIEKRGDR